MTFNFVADSIQKGRAYPALANLTAETYTAAWRQFRHNYPYTVPADIIDYCEQHNYPYKLYRLTDSFPGDSYYPVALGFFDFAIDYFDLLPNLVKCYLRDNALTLLFYYHEGDNPARIKQRLDQLCAEHDLPNGCYRFVSGNSSANNLANFVYFADHELLYWSRNSGIPANDIVYNKTKQFTLLSRTHKWWRATTVADLHRANLLVDSIWSYNTQITADDNITDNPIQIDHLNLRDYLEDFLAKGPYKCDDLTGDEHNDHHRHVEQHYTDSACSIILETHFDADQSSGTFLTEKTFKAIKHGHPFVLLAPAGSLSVLRELGYRTFDSLIDNTYDSIEDNTQRYLAVKNTITQLYNKGDLTEWYISCREDILHNQRVFTGNKYTRIEDLYTKLQST